MAFNLDLPVFGHFDDASKSVIKGDKTSIRHKNIISSPLDINKSRKVN
jgi:hypothetical protein